MTGKTTKSKNLWKWLGASAGAALLALLATNSSHAQLAGLGGILNPEGSRLFPQTFVFPRHPGKPDLRWKEFDWKYVDTAVGQSVFRLYFYEEEFWAAQFALSRIRNQVEFLSDVFNYRPSKEFNYLLFTSHREFQQANIFDISEGVQGVTSTTEQSMAIPYWGETETFRHISTHEMVHQFQVQKINDLAKYYSMEVMAQIPLWFIEGMAEYYSQTGIDAEARMYIRDILLHEDKKRKYEVPGFFEVGQMSFVHVYKLGQAKIHFLETEFGVGTAQKIFQAAGEKIARTQELFPDIVSKAVGKTPEEVQRLWDLYLRNNYKEEAEKLSQKIDDYKAIEAAGETLDLYDISPDGTMMAVREIDPLIGSSRISIIDLKKDNKRSVVIQDNQPNALSLYFMQNPTIAITDKVIVYGVETTAGPELEIRPIERDKSGEIKVGKARRVELHKRNIMQISSPTISPDGKRVAFAGLSRKGWQDIYVASLTEEDPELCPLTNDFYSWKTPYWGKDGIIVSSDKTDSRNYSLFKLDPDTGKAEQLTWAPANQLAPFVNTDGEILFQSWQSGTPQIHMLKDGKEVRLTEAKTGLLHPKMRSGELYALGFKAGRYHLYQIPKEKRLSIDVPVHVDIETLKQRKPWQVELANVDEADIKSYKPFVSSGTRLDNIAGFFGSGTVGGLTASMSDLMRNYRFQGELSVFGDFRFTNLNLFLSSWRGRTTWTLGGYHTLQPRLADIFDSDLNAGTNTFLYREFGALAALQYPLGAFTYVDAGVRTAGVKRSDFSDPTMRDAWDDINPGVEFMVAPIMRFGYDRVVYELFTGPLKGFGLLAESDTSVFPARGVVSPRLRLDLAYYFHLAGRSVLALQGIMGGSWGGDFRQPFFISSDDILRAYPFGDPRLLGHYVGAGKAELRFPIGSLFGFPPLRGLAALDYGTVFSRKHFANDNITSSYTGGLSLNLPPLSINFMLSKPVLAAPGPVDGSVMHFTLRYLYL